MPAAAKPAHPPLKSMIKNAIKELKDKKGSSKSAIVKYISANYKVSADKVQNQTKLAVRRIAAKKKIVHASSKSIGASGSFDERGIGALEVTANVDGEMDCTDYELSVFGFLLE